MHVDDLMAGVGREDSDSVLPRMIIRLLPVMLIRFCRNHDGSLN